MLRIPISTHQWNVSPLCFVAVFHLGEVHGDLQASVRLKEKLAEMEAAKTSAEERFHTPTILTNDTCVENFCFRSLFFF